MKTERIPIEKIRIDGGTQCRVQMDQDTIDQYVEEAKLKQRFPPIDVNHDGTHYWLWDGFHRYHAAVSMSIVRMNCNIHEGSQIDAIEQAAGCNSKHGKPRTRADVRKSIVMFLIDERWKERSNRWIARTVNCDEKLVRNVKSELETADNPQDVIPHIPTPPRPAITTKGRERINDTGSPPREKGEAIEGQVFDHLGQEVRTDSVKQHFANGEIFANTINDIQRLKRGMQGLKKQPISRHVHWPTFAQGVKYLIQSIREGRPFAICPKCSEDAHDECICRGTGWLPKAKWDRLPPEFKVKIGEEKTD